MSDIDIEVDGSDLKNIISQLQDYEGAFVKMVNTVQTESNRMNRATKATADQIQTAMDRMTKSASTGLLADILRKEQKEFQGLQKEITNAVAFWKNYDSQISITGKKATDLGATFTRLGSVLDAQEKATTNYWSDFENRIGTVGKKATDLGATFTKLGSIIQNETAQAKKYWDDFNKSLGGQSASQNGATFAALDAQIQSLTNKYAPLAAATNFYEKEVRNLTLAHKLEIISSTELEKQLELLKYEYDSVQKGAYIAGSRFNQFGQMAEASGKRMQKVGMYAQQAGYQFGDLAVQIQGGTNVGVAFSQQMAQLAGLIPGVAGAVTTFAVIGIGLLIQNLTGSKKAAKEAEEAYKDVGTALDKIEAIRKAASPSDAITANAKVLKNEYRDVLDMMEQVASRQLKSSLDEPIKNLQKAVDKAKKDLMMAQAGSMMGTDSGAGIFTSADVLNTSADTAKENKALLDQQNILTTILQIRGDTRQELQESLRYAVDYLNNNKLMTPELQQQLTLLSEQLGIKDQISDADKRQLAAVSKVKDYYVDQTRAILDQTRVAQQSLDIEQAKHQYGDQSAQVIALQKKYLLENLAIEGQRNGLSQEQVNHLVEMSSNLYDIEQATLDSADATGSFADGMARAAQEARNVSAALSAIAGFQIDAVAAQVETRILQETGDLKKAARGRMAYERDAKYNTEKKEVLSRYTGRFNDPGYQTEIRLLDEKRNAEANAIKAQETRDDLRESIRESGRDSKRGGRSGGGGGGKGKKAKLTDEQKDAKKAKEDLEKFNEEFALNLEQQKRMIGVYGEARKEQEKIVDIERRLGTARKDVSDQQIQTWAKEELALENLRDLADQTFDTLSSNFSNFFMSVVDGASSIGDAFKSMLSNILRDIYQAQVAKPAADWLGNVFSGFLKSANGNAFTSSGTKFFADGGVVNGPTAFKYAGGNGVMGEAGPEAIMPLKRNSQGKLGVAVSGNSGNDVNITQVFQFSANGDESVKQIIKSQMPQIQQAAIQGVIAAKRKNIRGIN